MKLKRKTKQNPKLRDWRKEFARQSREHPKLPSWAVKQVASDHLRLKKRGLM